MSLEIIRPDGNPELVLASMKQVLVAYEADFSRFKSDSLVSRLNAGERVALTPELKTLIETTTKLASQTNQHFNAHIDLRALGYDSTFEAKDFQLQRPSDPPPPFPEGLLLEDETVRLQPGSAIDFGGFLKGYLSQKLAEQYQTAGQGIIINLGGDLSVRGEDLDQTAFEVGVYNPVLKADVPLELRNQSLSTSGTYKRQWELDGETFHHLVAPESNANPESDLVSVSVWGPDGSLTDAFATAVFALAPNERDAWIKAQTDYTFLTIDHNGYTNLSV